MLKVKPKEKLKKLERFEKEAEKVGENPTKLRKILKTKNFSTVASSNSKRKGDSKVYFSTGPLREEDFE